MTIAENFVTTNVLEITENSKLAYVLNEELPDADLFYVQEPGCEED